VSRLRRIEKWDADGRMLVPSGADAALTDLRNSHSHAQITDAEGRKAPVCAADDRLSLVLRTASPG
jgi:hypothetical protein